MNHPQVSKFLFSKTHVYNSQSLKVLEFVVHLTFFSMTIQISSIKNKKNFKMKV